MRRCLCSPATWKTIARKQWLPWYYTMVALLKRLISSTIRIRPASQPLCVCLGKKSFCCQEKRKNGKKKSLSWRPGFGRSNLWMDTHVLHIIARENQTARPHRISQNAHFAWHPACDRDKSRMPVEQFNKKPSMQWCFPRTVFQLSTILA